MVRSMVSRNLPAILWRRPSRADRPQTVVSIAVCITLCNDQRLLSIVLGVLGRGNKKNLKQKFLNFLSLINQ